MSCFLLLPGVSLSETKSKTGSQIHVVSDKMIALKDESSAEFIGNVTVTRDESILKADHIKIYFETDNTKNSESNIKQIVAQGNVEYSSLDRKATADKAVYSAIDETLILTGNTPKVVTGQSYVSGEKIIVYQKTDQVVVEGGGTQRVEAIFNPEDNKKN